MSKGVSLIELLLVVAIVGFVGLLIANLPSSIASINKSRHSSLAREIANKEMDVLRKGGYSSLEIRGNGVYSFTDPQLSGLQNPSASYELDDCPAQICTNSEKAKQVKVQVSWSESGDNKTIDLTTIIGEGGVAQL